MTTFADLNDLVIGATLSHPFGEGIVERVEQHPDQGITTVTLEGGIIVSIPSTTEVPINVDVITEEEAQALAAYRAMIVASHEEGLIDFADRRRLLCNDRMMHMLEWLRKR